MNVAYRNSEVAQSRIIFNNSMYRYEFLDGCLFANYCTYFKGLCQKDHYDDNFTKETVTDIEPLWKILSESEPETFLVVSPAARASQVDKLLLKHNNRPMNALYFSLQDRVNQGVELPMAIIMDRRCGIERRAEEPDVGSALPFHLDGASPLLLAIDAGRVDVANALLAAGSDSNAMNSYGRNCLMIAARTLLLESAELLISYGADINAVDENGSTALHHATYWGVESLIDLLEQSGANLEAVDNYGCTPLHDAALHGKVGATKVLLDLGANEAAVNNEGHTPDKLHQYC